MPAKRWTVLLVVLGMVPFTPPSAGRHADPAAPTMTAAGPDCRSHPTSATDDDDDAALASQEEMPLAPFALAPTKRVPHAGVIVEELLIAASQHDTERILHVTRRSVLRV